MTENTKILEFTVTAEHDGFSVHRFLHLHLDYLSADAWKRKIWKGMVEVSGEKITQSRNLATGEQVRVTLPDKTEPEVDTSYEIILKEESFIIIHKSGNLPVHPSGVYFDNTLTHLYRKQHGEILLPVHRIDRETSGLLVLARNKAADRELKKSFENRQAGREYEAVVHGLFPQALSASGFICEDTSSQWRGRKSIFAEDKARLKGCAEATSHFVRLQTFEREGIWYSRLFVSLRQGRKNQIRATLTHLGFPILGDMLYAKDETLYRKYTTGELSEQEARETLRIHGMALHSSFLAFPHPFENRLVAARTSMPPLRWR